MFVTIAITQTQIENAKRHAQFIDLLVITNKDVNGLNCVRPPFHNSSDLNDVFWRMIYIDTLKTDVFFISSDEKLYNYGLLKTLATLDKNVFFVDPAVVYKNGSHLSSTVFKLKKDDHGFVQFKIFEYALKNLGEFNKKMVYAPERNILMYGLTQYIFAHLPIDVSDAVILTTGEICQSL